MSAAKKVLCPAAELQNNDAREFTLDINNTEQSVFIVNRAGKFFAYYNSCPHTGSPLNWQGDVFLDTWKQKIQCSLHGALFEIHSGKCIYGPCKDQSLRALETRLENHQIVVLI